MKRFDSRLAKLERRTPSLSCVGSPLVFWKLVRTPKDFRPTTNT
jgi:hypothetical protein